MFLKMSIGWILPLGVVLTGYITEGPPSCWNITADNMGFNRDYYKGTVSKSVSGEACLRWDNVPNSVVLKYGVYNANYNYQHDYCREEMNQALPGCIVTDHVKGGYKWEGCIVPLCSGYQQFCIKHRISGKILDSKLESEGETSPGECAVIFVKISGIWGYLIRVGTGKVLVPLSYSTNPSDGTGFEWATMPPDGETTEFAFNQENGTWMHRSGKYIFPGHDNTYRKDSKPCELVVRKDYEPNAQWELVSPCNLSRPILLTDKPTFTDCGMLQIPVHGHLSAGVTTLGATKTLTCDSGYTPNVKSISCQTDICCNTGIGWSDIPKCNPEGAINSTTPGYRCEDDNYQCMSGECIDYGRLCDNHQDCKDNSDELHCEAVQLGPCLQGYFQCDNNRCIREAYYCDGDNDCGDNSDEKCRANDNVRAFYIYGFIRDAYRFVCQLYSDVAYQWYLPSWQKLCDGTVDCPNGEDESAARCDARKCYRGISAYSNCTGSPKCNLLMDICRDSSTCAKTPTLRRVCDMMNCSKSGCRCIEGAFHCKSGECINPGLECNGHQDCLDNSDELHCQDACRDIVSFGDHSIKKLTMDGTPFTIPFHQLFLSDPLDDTGSFYIFHRTSIFPTTGWLKCRGFDFGQCGTSILFSKVKCFVDTIRIYGGYIYCFDSTDTNRTSLVKVDLQSGVMDAIKKLSVSLKKPNSDKLLALDEPNINFMFDRSELWVLFKDDTKNSQHGYFVLEQLDINDLGSIRKAYYYIAEDKLSSKSPIIMACGKIYHLDFNSNEIRITKASDMLNSRNKFRGNVSLGRNPFAKHDKLVSYYDPIASELYIFTIHNSHNGTPIESFFKIPFDTCNSKFKTVDLSFMNSTFLWSLGQTEFEKLHTKFEIIYRMFQTKTFDQISNLTNTLLSCRDTRCKSPNQPTTKSCIIDRLLSSLNVYTKHSHGNRSSVVLNIGLNIRDLLTQQSSLHLSNQISVLEQTLSDSVNNLTHIILDKDSSFKNSFSNYFNTLAIYDQKKSEADIEFIHGRIRSYQNSIIQISQLIKYDINNYSKYALASTIVDVANSFLKDVLLPILSFLNPGKLIAGDNIKEIWDGIDNLSKAALLVKEAAGLTTKTTELVRSLVELQAKVNSIADKQQSIRHMILAGTNYSLHDETVYGYMDAFLKEYNNYDPIFSKGMFAGIDHQLQDTIEALCKLIFDAQSALSHVPAYVLTKGDCADTKARITQLMVIYDEMYDFQFELMEAMSNYVRAVVDTSIAAQIASNITEVIDSSETQQKPIMAKMYAFQVYIANKMHIKSLVEQACDLIEYKNNELSSELCRIPPYDPLSQEFQKLSAYNYEAKMCPRDTDVSLKYVDIPAMVRHNESLTDPFSWIDLEKLYNGQEVIFQAPSKSWLVSNGWLNTKDKERANFISAFELILPPIFTGLPKEINVHAETVLDGDNRIYPGEKQYSFYSLVHEKYIQNIYTFRYLVDYASCPTSNYMDNPYNSFGCDPIKKPCIISEGSSVPTTYLPSIYARWKFRATFQGGNLTRPDPVGDFYLKARLKICHKIRHKRRAHVIQRSSRFNAGCCGERDQFYNTSIESCQKCPKGTCPNMEGYYCERNCSNAQSSHDHGNGLPIYIPEPVPVG